MKWIVSELVGTAVLFICFIAIGVKCQENGMQNLSPSLYECYDGDRYAKWNLLPHNMETLIAILRKIEDSPGLHMDLQYLATALLHRFRQDGVERNPEVKPRAGILPYAILGNQFYRHRQILLVVPGNAVNFPNDSISAVERCTLHSMLSSSIDIHERGDESRVCKMANYAFRRFGRSVTLPQHEDVKEDVETLTPEQIDVMSKADMGKDPNSEYPALPPNHPNSARLTNLPPNSRCPIENGVVKTRWGSVSAGSVLAGIAASLRPELIRIGDLIKSQVEARTFSYPTEANLDNKFLATMAGDIGEVVLLQTPQFGPNQAERYILGAEGNWNSSNQPLYYFLNSNEHLQLTGAEIRGNLDGLILANQLPNYYKQIRELKLSQIFDMYYSNRGFFDPNYRACNRRSHFLNVAPTATLKSQAHSAALVLMAGLARATFSSEALEKYVEQAVKDLSTFIPTMNNDMSCENTNNIDTSEAAVDLTIIVDTNWPFNIMKSILEQLLNGLDVSKYNSNITLMSAMDGSIMINSTNTILDVHNFNSSSYDKYAKGFDLSRAMEQLGIHQMKKLNEEQRLGWGGGKSDVVLFMHYQKVISQSEKEYSMSLLNTMHEKVPDATVLFLTSVSKDQWFDLVLNSNTDIFSISLGETTEYYPIIDTLQSRIKQVPRRLINSQCGACYESKGVSHSFIDYVGPHGVNYYRIHPNYFYTTNTENPPRVKVQGTGIGSLKVCVSRDLLHLNATSALAAAICNSITSNSYTFDLNCEGASYIHECKPFYLSVTPNSNNTGTFECRDKNVCRFPDNIKYTISYDNLVCESGASTLLVTPLFLLTIFARYF